MKKSHIIILLSPWVVHLLFCLAIMSGRELNFMLKIGFTIAMVFSPLQVPVLNIVAIVLLISIGAAIAYNYKYKIYVITLLQWLYVAMVVVSTNYLIAASA